MNSTQVVAPVTHPDEDTFTQVAYCLYHVFGIAYFCSATIVHNRLLLRLLDKMRMPIFAFLEPWTYLANLLIYRAAVDYLIHYGILLNLSEAVEIRLWPRLLPPPDCQAQANELPRDKSTMCLIYDFKEWLALLGQSGGMGKMMSFVAVGRIVICVGVVWMFWFAGRLNVRNWNHAVQRGSCHRFVGSTMWTRGRPQDWDDKGCDEHECKTGMARKGEDEGYP